MITREKVAQQIRDYLNHWITLEELVRWAEEAMMEGEFAGAHASRFVMPWPVWVLLMSALLD